MTPQTEVNGQVAVKLFRESFQLPALLGVTPEAEEARNNLSLAAVRITAVTTAEHNEVAVGASRDIQTYIRRVKERGLEFRRPINDFTALVKKTEDDHLSPLLDDKARLDTMALGFAQAERRRVEAEERRIREEFSRLEAAKQSELKRISDEQQWREREAHRLQTEIDRKAQEAADAAAALAASATNNKLRAEAELARRAAQRAQEDAEEARHKAEALMAAKAEADAVAAAQSEAAIQNLLRQPAPEMSKATGSSVRQVLRFEVVDAAAVYRARPELCSLEVKAAAVKAVCFAAKGATEMNPDVTSVMGLRLWWHDDLSTRRR